MQWLTRLGRARDISLGTRHCQRTGRFKNAARIGKNIFNGRADVICVDQQNLIDHLLCKSEGFFADLLDRRAIREQADITQHHPSTRFERARHRIRIRGLHTNHFNVRSHRFNVSANATDQAAAANRNKHGMNRASMLPQDLHGDSALTRNDLWIIKRMHKGQFFFFLQMQSMLVSIRIRLTRQHHLATARTHCFDLQRRCCCGHHDHGAAPQRFGRQRDTLRVITRRGANHTSPELCGCQLRHLVVRSTQLEAEHALHIFAFQVDTITGAVRERGRELERCFNRKVINARCENLLQITGRHSHRL